MLKTRPFQLWKTILKHVHIRNNRVEDQSSVFGIAGIGAQIRTDGSGSFIVELRWNRVLGLSNISDAGLECRLDHLQQQDT